MRANIFFLFFVCLMLACEKNEPTSIRGYGSMIATDEQGSIYIAGVNFDGEILVSVGEEKYALMSKWDAAGKRLWMTRDITLSETQFAYFEGDVAIDINGNIFVVGTVAGTIEGKTSMGGINDKDAFIVKYDSAGLPRFVKLIGTKSHEEAYAVKIDKTGNIFVTGYTQGNLVETDPVNDCGTSPLCADAFLAKLNPTGDLIYMKQWGNDGAVEGFDVALDVSGNAYVTGRAFASLDGNPCVENEEDGLCWDDAFLTKWNADGSKAWTKQWGTDGWDYGKKIVVDNQGDIYVAQNTYPDGEYSLNNIILTKWHSDGTQVFSKQVNQTAGQMDIDTLKIDTEQNVLVGGFKDRIIYVAKVEKNGEQKSFYSIDSQLSASTEARFHKGELIFDSKNNVVLTGGIYTCPKTGGVCSEDEFFLDIYKNPF